MARFAGVANVHLHAAAVGVAAGSVRLMRAANWDANPDLASVKSTIVAGGHNIAGADGIDVAMIDFPAFLRGLIARAGRVAFVKIDIEGSLAALLHQTNQPLGEAAQEMIVLELYRRGAISSGKAAELLGKPRLDFIRHASHLGIAYVDMTPEEWEAEKKSLDAWPRS